MTPQCEFWPAPVGLLCLLLACFSLLSLLEVMVENTQVLMKSERIHLVDFCFLL